MINIFLEVDRLKVLLRNRGLDESTIELIAAKAENEITLALREKLNSALDVAIQSGVQQNSSDFINDLRPRQDAFMIDTASGSTDFTEPPYPMLDRLLANGAKPMKDGSGVYKVIPIGKQGPKKPLIHNNIFDAQKAISAERYESAVAQYNNVIPKSSKVTFRTATSKQSRQTQWVQPEKVKDFTQDLADINRMLLEEHDNVILGIIRSYSEGF